MSWVLRRLPLHLTVLAAVALWSVPSLALFVSSVRPPSAIATSGWWHALLDGAPTLENYVSVLGQRGLGRSFANSLLISVPATLLSVVVASMAAYALSWTTFRGRSTIFLLTVGLLAVPIQTTLIPVLELLARLTVRVPVPLVGGNLFGVSSFAGIWLAHSAYGLPFAVFLLRNFFISLPRDLIEAARLDGASEWRLFTSVILPLSAPALAALAIFQFLWVWNDLLIALVILGDPELAPVTLRLTNLVSSFGSSYQLLTAAAVVSMALPLAIFATFQRFFVQGLLAGALKG